MCNNGREFPKNLIINVNFINKIFRLYKMKVTNYDQSAGDQIRMVHRINRQRSIREDPFQMNLFERKVKTIQKNSSNYLSISFSPSPTDQIENLGL